MQTSLLLPATTQRFVQLNQCQQFIESSLNETQFRRKRVCFIRQNLEVSRDTAVVAQVRKAGSVLRGFEELLLMATEKVVQRILRHAKPHLTKERYIKAFDPAVLAAMKTLETTLDDFHKCSATVQRVN